MQIVGQLEAQLDKEKGRLQAMMGHLDKFHHAGRRPQSPTRLKQESTEGPGSGLHVPLTSRTAVGRSPLMSLATTTASHAGPIRPRPVSSLLGRSSGPGEDVLNCVCA
jgi:hypothetical protein